MGKWVDSKKGRRSFEQEIAGAAEVGADWEVSNQGASIVFDSISGWKDPLWGSDSSWLYLRRPEGVWKTKINTGAILEGGATLYIRSSDGSRLLGGKTIGPDIVDQKGWHHGRVIDAGSDAADRDQIIEKPELIRLGLSRATTINGKVLEDGPDRMVLQMGDSFSKSPKFSFAEGWVLAKDHESDFMEGYSLEGNPSILEEIKKGRVWFNYGSRWMSEPFNVRVEFESAA